MERSDAAGGPASFFFLSDGDDTASSSSSSSSAANPRDARRPSRFAPGGPGGLDGPDGHGPPPPPGFCLVFTALLAAVAFGTCYCAARSARALCACRRGVHAAGDTLITIDSTDGELAAPLLVKA